MTKTVVGLFDERSAAQAAARGLLEEGFPRERMSLMARHAEGADEGVRVAYVEEDGHEQVEEMAKGAGTGAAIGGAAGLFLGLTALAIPVIGPVLAAGPLAAALAGAGVGATAGGLFSGLTRLGVPDTDAEQLAEGVLRGGTLLSVEAPEGMADRAVAVMKHHGAVEIDKRASEWREKGWSGFDEGTTRYVTSPAVGGREEGADVTAEHERVPARTLNAAHGEIALPVVEERLEVDKREVERGGVRLHSRVTESPVEERVDVREEHVHVERRPADYTFHGGESEAFKESYVEIREAYEELVVNKKARVVEEVVVGKDVEQRTETVRETLRRTDVEVEPLEPGERARTASASPLADDSTPGAGPTGRE